MTTRKKSDARKFLEKITGGPLTFGRTLAAIRKGEEMSQTEFGKILGITKAKVSDIEKGRRLISPERAAAWAKKLGYAADQFVRLAIQDQLNKSGLKRFKVKIEAA